MNFDEEKINRYSGKFDQQEFDRYRVHLLSISEEEAFSLSAVTWYDRGRFLKEQEGDMLRKKHSVQVPPKSDENSSTSKPKYARSYKKDWMND
ncbi:MAG: hypothetical protein ACYC6W_10910 [Nitrosotalea sp.]